MFQSLKDIFQEIKSEIVNNEIEVAKESHRSTDEVLSLLNIFDQFVTILENYTKEFKNLYVLFADKISGDELCFEKDNVLQVLFFEDCLFPKKGTYNFVLEEKINPELMGTLVETFSHEIEDFAQIHKDSQIILKSKDLDSNLETIKCKCIECSSDYKTKLREKMVLEAKSILYTESEKLQEILFDKDINYIVKSVEHVSRKIERISNSAKFHLKKSSQKKLETELRDLFLTYFNAHSPLGKMYIEKLKIKFNGLLLQATLPIDLISDFEYSRFFDQLKANLWKPEAYIVREFHKLKDSVMMLKRTDISATILNEHLGQFWVHSSARKIKRKFIYHMGPTNSGKTYHAIQALCEAPKGCYLAPLRLLASELFDTMNEKNVKTSLLTGEEVMEIEGATHYSSTIEMAKLHEEFDCAVIDEIQMITDPQRGWAWTRAMVNLISHEIHLCGDKSVLDLVKIILQLTGDTLEIRNYERKTELIVQKNAISLSEMQKSDALIVFSRRNALKYKADLERLGHKVSIVYGMLSPEVRREQARRFDSGETDIMVSTDAIAMGMNLPVKRIVFSALSKFIDSKECPISQSEIKQIAGRAGRFGRFPTGYVTSLRKVEMGYETVSDALEVELDQKEMAMVGPDLEIFRSVNEALASHSLPSLDLPEFLQLFNTMNFTTPFYCVDLKEMIQIAELVEGIDFETHALTDSEKFGFTCAPVNLNLEDHVNHFASIVKLYVNQKPILSKPIDTSSVQIDYLETAIKCVELYQWLARHFNNKFFEFELEQLLENKMDAVEKLNLLLSERIKRTCSSCGCVLADLFEYNICEDCFSSKRKVGFRKPAPHFSKKPEKSFERKSKNEKPKKRKFRF